MCGTHCLDLRNIHFYKISSQLFTDRRTGPWQPCFYQGLTKNEREQNVTHPFAPQINDITLMKRFFTSSLYDTGDI